MLQDIDTLVIGAGLAGATAARLLADKGEKVLIVEKREHIGGNCYDERHFKSGALVHKYGPHLFHTDDFDAWEFMMRFSAMDVYEHKVVADIDGKIATLPFNLETLYQVFPNTMAMELELLLTERYGYGDSVGILELKRSDEPELQFLADYIYKNVFVNYTIKQWGLRPEDIDEAVTARVPVRVSRDGRYFTDAYQGVPRYGYTVLFQNMLRDDNIHTLLNTPSKEVLEIKGNKTYFMGKEFKGKVIYTGGLDELFDYEFKPLPYRSVFMHFDTIPVDKYQDAATMNYPNNYSFTRITEFKNIHKIFGNKGITTILKEYPRPYVMGENEPYYPMFTDAAKKLYKKYADKAKKIKNLILLGRLAEYKYYDMDDIIIRVMEQVAKI